MNEKPNVDQTLQERVRQAMVELNYRVNVNARGMILRRSFNIGIVIPSLTDPFFPRFASHFEQAIEDRGSHVLIASSQGDDARERKVCDSLVSKQIDGLILTPCCRENTDYFNTLAADGLPIVQLGRYFNEIHVPVVMAENYTIGRNAVKRFYELGHRRMLHLAGVSDSNPDIERARGFTDTPEELGIGSLCRIRASLFTDRQFGIYRFSCCKPGCSAYGFHRGGNDHICVGAFRTVRKEMYNKEAFMMVVTESRSFSCGRVLDSIHKLVEKAILLVCV